MNRFTEQRNLKHIEKEDKEKRPREEKRENEGEKSDGRILNVQFVSGGQKFHSEREKVKKKKKKKKTCFESKV